MATFLALLAYAMTSTFTPGPNNITAAAAGVRLGWKGSIPYMTGAATGFLVVLAASGFLNLTLSRHLASIALWIKWIGCAYLLWLSASLFMGGKKKDGVVPAVFSFPAGFLLQFVNPKVILYGITLYGMFPSLLLRDAGSILISAVIFALLGLASVSLWCLVGTTLSKKLENRTASLIFNIVLAVLLVLTAFGVALG